MRKDTGRVFDAVLAAFSLFTATWVAWGLATQGDLFANGNYLSDPSLFVAIGLGYVLGRFSPWRIRALTLTLSALSLCFWLFVPSGWWAHGPH